MKNPVGFALDGPREPELQGTLVGKRQETRQGPPSPAGRGQVRIVRFERISPDAHLRIEQALIFSE